MDRKAGTRGNTAKNRVVRTQGGICLRIISWNANGIRALMKKDLKQWAETESPDILCFQETKIHESQITDAGLDVPGYFDYWASAEKKGYSGVALYTKKQPLEVVQAVVPELDDGEGRILQAQFEDFLLLNIYFPNGQASEERLQYKLRFYDHLIPYLKSLSDQGKKVIVCGDYNTAHHPIDLKNPESNENYSGFMPIERIRLDHLMKAGYIDVFRRMYPDRVQYSWWTYRFKARERNIGWRIDYFFVTENVFDDVSDCIIMDQVTGSDHCPVQLVLK